MRLPTHPLLLILPTVASSTDITPAPSLPIQTTLSSADSLIALSQPPLSLDFYEKNDPRLELRQAPAVAPAAAPAAAPKQPAPAPAAAPANGGAGAVGGAAPKPGAGGAAPVVPGAAAAQPAPAAPVPGAAAPVVAPAAPVPGVGGAGAAPPAVLPSEPGQVPSVTVFMQKTIIAGATQQIPVTYTQKFSDVPSKGPSPTSGKIGLGTITGSVGAVRTDEAKQAAAKSGAMSFAKTIPCVRLWIMGSISFLVAMGSLTAL